MKKILRYIYIYSRLISQQLKAILEYQSNFWISVISGAFSQALGFIFLWVLFRNIPEIQGWLFWEMVFLYAMVYFTEGFCSAFFEGIWGIGFFVNRGELDRMLIRPVPVIIQILSSRIGMNGYGNILLGGVLITMSLINMNITLTVLTAVYAFIILISAIVVRMAIYTAAQSSAFWLKANSSSFPFMVHTIGDFSKYPINLFPAAIKAVICLLIPFAFVSYFPTAFIFGKEGQVIGMFTPLAAVLFMSAAVGIFYLGLKKYDSTGN